MAAVASKPGTGRAKGDVPGSCGDCGLLHACGVLQGVGQRPHAAVCMQWWRGGPGRIEQQGSGSDASAGLLGEKG